MGSDRARVSYDPSRQWRGVISQQGRVTLEADWNEAAAIASEEDREQLLDVVGPSGTPDQGYQVTAIKEADGKATGGLMVGKGTVYVGGERMELETEREYAKQPDWVDANRNDPLWVKQMPPASEGDVDEAVYLLLREQEVGAVEDPALLDMALGGPDTSERLRILQRIVRQSSKQGSCSGALSELEKRWKELGLHFEQETMRLESTARLQVSFNPPPGAATPCQPVAQGGYLGAENQLIRVQVANVEEGAPPTLVWGFDNAHFLYRIEPKPEVDEKADETSITLKNIPVDSYHQPAKGCAVEVLEAAAEISTEDYIAATTGIVTSVASAYAPDTRTLTIATALKAPTTESPLLFLRVWEETIAYTGAVELGKTGVTVTLGSKGEYHVGDYWTFAVRPGTPTTMSPVYPQRILEQPQPPDGPRLWACPLAVVTWASGVPEITDCLPQFENLVTLTGSSGGCCTVDVSPADVDGGATLQALIDRYADREPTTICLSGGPYVLPAPLVIGSGHKDLTIQACERGVALKPAEPAHASFRLGLVVLEEPVDLTLRGLELELPNVPFPFDEHAIVGVPKELHELLVSYGRELSLSIGVYVGGGSGVSIEGCKFHFASNAANVFGAGVFGARAIDGLDILDCAFTAPEAKTVPIGQAVGGRQVGPYEIRFGFLQVPTRALTARKSTKAQEAAASLALPSLANAVIERNVFDGLTVPVLVIGKIGTMRLEDNTVRSCYGGFWLLTLATAASSLLMLDRMQAGSEAMTNALASLNLTALGDPVVLLATVLGRIIPVAVQSTEAAGVVGVIERPTTALLRDGLAQFGRFYPKEGSGATGAEGTEAAGAEAAKAPGAEATKATKATKAAKAARKTSASAAAKITADVAPELAAVFEHADYAAAGDLVPEADPGTGLIARLGICSNQVDAVIAEADSGAALLVLILDTTEESSLIASANRMRSRVVLGATASLRALHECAITGNIISNETEFRDERGATSIVLEPEVDEETPLYAVTGNVFVGLASLPNRPAPLERWATLNTVRP